MSICIVTGSTGLIGSEAVSFFKNHFDMIVGLDNDMRAYFFGDAASTKWKKDYLENNIPNYKHIEADIRDISALDNIFNQYSSDIKLVIHTAAQPSHDWAAQEPLTDFNVNAVGTINMLECTRKYSPEAVFIFTSTNKVYGDAPNELPLKEQGTRWELESSHPFYKNGIDESMRIDQSVHSVFGASKVAADVMVQEYASCYGLKAGVFRGGCLTGSSHSGTELHGFLNYLVKCTLEKKKYTIFGYKGKQVRDNIHSEDLINCFYEYYKAPRSGAVYNIGGSRHSNCSVLEAIDICHSISGHKLQYDYMDTNRRGDHIWWISDVSRFKKDYPNWDYSFDINKIIEEIVLGIDKRLS